MANSKDIVELTDLSCYKDSFTTPLAELGVRTVDDLSRVLMDEEKTSSMISSIKGLGPKTVILWKKALSLPIGSMEARGTEKEETLSDPEGCEIETETAVEQMAPTSEQEEELKPKDSDKAPMGLKLERNLYCTMADLEEIEKTAVKLLRMNGSKRKGLMASVDFAAKELTGAGMEVTVDRGADRPVVVATKGDGGVVLWGHLDTERLGGMKKKRQGIIQGDMINGRGAAKMKGAVAAMICVANRLVSWQVPFSIVLTTDALDQQKGAEAMADDSMIRHSKGIIIMAPTGMRPIIGQYGYAAVLVTTYGEGAVITMASFLKDLTNQIGESSDRFSFKTGLIRGGKRKMPYAPALSCQVVLEFETRVATDAAIEMVEGILGESEHEVEILCRSEMAEFDRTSDLVAAVTELTKVEPDFAMVHSEAAKIVSANPRIVICGPGDVANSMSNQEYVTLSELEKTFESILSLVDGAEPLEE